MYSPGCTTTLVYNGYIATEQFCQHICIRRCLGFLAGGCLNCICTCLHWASLSSVSVKLCRLGLRKQPIENTWGNPAHMHTHTILPLGRAWQPLLQTLQDSVVLNFCPEHRKSSPHAPAHERNHCGTCAATAKPQLWLLQDSNRSLHKCWQLRPNMPLPEFHKQVMNTFCISRVSGHCRCGRDRKSGCSTTNDPFGIERYRLPQNPA